MRDFKTILAKMDARYRVLLEHTFITEPLIVLLEHTIEQIREDQDMISTEDEKLFYKTSLMLRAEKEILNDLIAFAKDLQMRRLQPKTGE